MNKETNQEQIDPKELAALLRKPKGEKGIKVAEMLNATNIHITNFTYNSMALEDGQHILEIGFGNGKLMPELLKRNQSLTLTGVDFAEDMVAQGEILLKNYIESGHINLAVASVEALPFEDNYFDAICTINTLYFWPEANECCKEVLRVLKPGGRVYIGIRPKGDAQKVPATQFGFTLYEKKEAIALLESAGFKEVHVEEQTDPPVEFSGEQKIFDSWVVIGTK